VAWDAEGLGKKTWQNHGIMGFYMFLWIYDAWLIGFSVDSIHYDPFLGR
jgi:hypothetical protein